MKSFKSRKVLSVLLALALVVGILPAYTLTLAPRAQAFDGYCGGSVTWTFSNGTLTISGSGLMDDYSVQSVGSAMITTAPYSNDHNLATSIVIESGVTHIGNCAFYGFAYVESVTIADTVKSIGNEAFQGCGRLMSLDTGSGVETIGQSAFMNCGQLQSVTLGSRVTTVDEHAFQNCAGLVRVGVTGPLRSIGKNAFGDCFALSDLTLPDSLLTIDNSCFYGCRNLRELTIPSSVGRIGYAAFAYCSRLEATLPDSVTDVGTNAFAFCSKVTEVSVAEQNTVYRCVNQCVIEKSSGTLVIGTGHSYIPSDGSVTAIGPHAFEGNARLTSLDIPLSVTTIGANAFNGCYNLRNVAYPGAQEDWDAIVIGENNTPLLGASLSLHIHTYVEEVITPATCTQEGLKRYTCSQCGKTFTAVVPISHPDADFDGVCDRCGLNS